MAVDEQYVLPPDVVVRSAEGLRPELRGSLGLASDEWVLARPHSRDLVAIVDAESAGLVEFFRTPRTILDAVLAHSEANALEPRGTLRRVFGTVRELVNGGLLVQAGSALADPIELTYQEGDRLGGFEILAPVHLATDTEVYLARHDDGFAAIKIARPGHERVMRRRLTSEAEALAILGGGVAPELLEAETGAERPYLALAWCAGVDADVAAAELRTDSEPGRRRLLDLVGRLLSAYATAHDAGVLHGDASMRNVLVDGRGRVILIDFGLARVPGQTADDAAPPRGLDLTTEPEAAAARLRGVAPEPTAAGEQYALAAMVYALLTGSERQLFTLEREALLQELAAPDVLPFGLHGVEGLPGVEAVVSRALSRAPGGRFDSVGAFRDAFEAAAASDLAVPARRSRPSGDREAGGTLLDEVAARLVSPGYEAELDGATSSAASGAAGIAYTLLRIAMVREDERLLAWADVWARRAATGAPAGGLHDGALGVHFVEARIAAARDDAAALGRAVEAFVSSCPPDDDLDVFSGSAGALLGCAILLDALPRTSAAEARRLVDARGDELAGCVQRGLDAVQDASPTGALGAAHGVAGMLFALLRWHESAGRPLPAEIDARLAWLAAKAIPEGRGMIWPSELGAPAADRTLAASWCNGAAGHVFLWALADRLLPHRYGDLAEAAAWSAWEDGAYVPDLCCGLAGRGYAMLTLYRRTRERAWLDRARQLAGRAAHHVRASLQPRDSLFHGELGIAVLIADLDRPDFGGMPLYEAEACPG